MSELFEDLDPPKRLLMGPGPINAHPRVLRAMSADLLGQFDPEMTGYMEQVMALYRPIFGTANHWTMLVDGTARAGIEAALVSLVAPGETVLVVNFGRFGLLLTEILTRIGARVETVEAPWGEVVPMEDLWQTMIKAPVFGMIIAMAGCYQGLQVKGNAEEVGLRTTTAVVQGIFLVIVLDAFFAVFFTAIGFT